MRRKTSELSSEGKYDQSAMEEKSAARLRRRQVATCFALTAVFAHVLFKAVTQHLKSQTTTMTATTKKPINSQTTVRLVVISDTHGHHDLLTPMMPPGDILLHCGDMAKKGSVENVTHFIEWISNLSQYPEKYVIDGNHDRDLDHPEAMNLAELFSSPTALMSGVRLLQDETVTSKKGGLLIHGSSWKSCEANSFDNLQKSVDVWMVHKHPYIKEEDVLVPRTDAVAPLSSYSTRYKGWKGSRTITQIVKDRKIPLCISGHVHWSRGILHLPVDGEKEFGNDKDNDHNQLPLAFHTFINAASLWPASVGRGMSLPVVIDYDFVHKRILRVQLEPYPRHN